MSETFGFTVNKEEAEILNAFLKWQIEDKGFDSKAQTMKSLLLEIAHCFAIPKTHDLIFPAPDNRHGKILISFDGFSEEQTKRLEQLSEQSGKSIAYIVNKGISAGLQQKTLKKEDL